MQAEPSLQFRALLVRAQSRNDFGARTSLTSFKLLHSFNMCSYTCQMQISADIVRESDKMEIMEVNIGKKFQRPGSDSNSPFRPLSI